ncbi:hypothetical protein EMCG_06511 [[Emmonsia] crescens]|uniref:Uncharacterized protein n=1 Tax=[Emmonsia] crescens TaxID=73230 RepID=A0A0G2J6Q1_9EURO|nr:hypothetical protein EMCG_06511 [Emmonsia crescens UAMH 3008]
MDNMQHLTPGGKLRKRASTQAIRENTEPNKRTDRSQDRDDDEATAHDLLNKIRKNREAREAQGTKEGWVTTKVRKRQRLYCCVCGKDVGGGQKCQLCGHECGCCAECLHERMRCRERSDGLQVVFKECPLSLSNRKSASHKRRGFSRYVSTTSVRQI